MVILNYRCPSLTIQAATHVLSGGSINELVIVENGSQDGSAELISEFAASLRGEHFGNVSVVVSAENLGYSGGNNLGLRYLYDHGCDIALVMNPDVRISGGVIDGLVSAIRGSVAVASPVLLHHRTHKVDAMGGSWRFRLGQGSQIGAGLELDVARRISSRSRGTLRTFSGACFSMKLDVIQRIGWLPDWLFLYGEEVDITQRLLANGYEFRVVEGLVALHDRGAAIGSSDRATDRSELSLFYSAQSAIRITRRWWPRYLASVVTARTIFGIILWLRGHRSLGTATIRGVHSGLGRSRAD